MARIKIEDIRAELEKDNWKVISDEYVNLSTEMIFECNEGHKVYSSWEKIRQKRECPICKQNFNKLNNQQIVPKKKGAKRILALDQSTHKTGWSIYDDDELIKFGVFETNLNDEIKRDNEIKNWFISMINNWKPDYIGIEDLFFQEGGVRMNVVIYKTLARLQGILMNSCYENGIEYEVVSPSTWRNYCEIKGKTRTDRKRAMQIKVKKWYDVSVSDDEADAVGIGKYIANNFQKQQIQNWE